MSTVWSQAAWFPQGSALCGSALLGMGSLLVAGKEERQKPAGRAGRAGSMGEGEEHSPQNHHVERVVRDAGYEGHEGDEEDGWEQEVGTGDRARSRLG